MEWLFIIAIGFICLIYPVITVVSLQWLPWYVSVAFAIWIICCITTIAYPSRKEKKWYERMIPSFVLTFVFSIVFFSSIDTEHYMFEDNVAMWIVAPALNLPLLYFIGMWVNGKWKSIKSAKREEHNKAIEREINEKRTIIQKLEKSIYNKTVIIHFVEMLNFCGEDTSSLIRDKRISNITKISSEIEQLHQEINMLQGKIKRDN